MEEKVKILLCEDDENLGMLLREFLQAKGFNADLCSDGERGYKAFLKGQYDLCVLDVMMPKKDGFTLAQEIRNVNADVPIIFLTAKTLKDDVLEGFKIGADDYITKPFSPSELTARIDAIYRRVSMSVARDEDEAATIESGPFLLNLKSRTVAKNGVPVDLTQVEYQIMEYFMNNQDTALDRSSILTHIWGENYYGDDKIVDVNIRRIRMKIEDEPSNPKYISTIWGFGYKWSVKEEKN